MFITQSRAGYLPSGEQYASGLFLMLFVNSNAPQPNGHKQIRALVRKVGLTQSGHFMMGRVTLMGHRFSLSGTYGSDGLPIEVTKYQATGKDSWGYGVNWRDVEMVPGLWERLHPLPPELVTAFWKHEHDNLVFMWASTHIETLKHLLPKPKKEGE